MDINLFRKFLAVKSRNKDSLTEGLQTHRIVGKVSDVRTFKVPLQGYVSRVFLDPVTQAKGLSLTSCMIEVEVGDKKDAFKKGEVWSFDAQSNPLASAPHTPAFVALRASKNS